MSLFELRDVFILKLVTISGQNFQSFDIPSLIMVLLLSLSTRVFLRINIGILEMYAYSMGSLTGPKNSKPSQVHIPAQLATGYYY